MTSTASPSFPRGIATVGYSTELPEGYTVRVTRDGYDALWLGRDISSEHDSYADACFAAQEHAAVIADEEAAADEAAAEAEYGAELDRLYNLVNAQGGYVAPHDKAGQARSRAIDTVLSLIDGLATKKAA